MRFFRFLFNIPFYIFVFLILLISLRGVPGNPTKENINSSSWKESGPFELSPERGRFALTFSLVEDRSFVFDLPIARFALPDLGYIDGKYVSLFAPGISFLIIPGYYLGGLYGISQVGSFAVISLFAYINVILINSIAGKLGAKKVHSLLASLAFIFATPAFTYAVSLYQHHVSVFLLLMAVYIYLNIKSWPADVIIWFLVAVSVAVDYPNIFMMLPLVILMLVRFFEKEEVKDFIKINFEYARLVGLLGAVLPLVFLGWVNIRSYGDPLKLSGMVENVRSIDEKGLPESEIEENSVYDNVSEMRNSNINALAFFNSRNISNGLFIHLFSPDRGLLLFAPFLFFSIFGAILLNKKNPHSLALLLGIGLINLFIYSMWGDPWGGWAFGSRYLIPLYAVASILIAVGLEKICKNKIIKTLFLTALLYSLFVNTLGALTSSANPPKVEAEKLQDLSGKEEKYTYIRNLDYLLDHGSKSYLYQSFLKDYITPFDFYFLISISISVIFIFFIFTTSHPVNYRKRPPLSVVNKKEISQIMLTNKKFSL